jgi:hypothetical protein
VAVDPHAAWAEVHHAAKLIGMGSFPKELPSAWANHVFNRPTPVALPMCLGAFPQQVSDVARLILVVELGTEHMPRCQNALTESQTKSLQASALISDTQRLLAVGVARLAGAYTTADALLQETACCWQTANELAANAWLAGRLEDAAAIWATLPENPVVMFNRGMADLILGRTETAIPALRTAIAGIDEHSGWHHLAQLYLTLAENR